MEKLEKLVALFNDKYPVGTMVMLKKDFVEQPVLTKVMEPAFILSGHSPVSFFEGISGCYHIRCVQGLSQ